MAAVFVIIYLIGFFGAVVVGRSRAGVTQRGRLGLATTLSSFEWFLHQLASMFLWPVFIIVWLVRGRPESPWRPEVSTRGTLRVVRVR